MVLNKQGITERINEMLQEFNSDRSFALKVGLDPGNFKKKRSGMQPWTVADVNKICGTLGVRKGWLVDGEGQKFKAPEEILDQIPVRSYDRGKGVPYFNVDFEMGYGLMEDDQTRNPDYMIDFTPYNKCDCWCNAKGNSMHPTISNGDVIAIKEIKDPKSCLISGEIYAIVTTNDLRTIKRIKDNGDTITMIPDNKEYPEQTISKELIRKVFRVMGSMKMF